MNATHPLVTAHPSGLLTPGQVSFQLGVTPETLQAWRTHGRYDLPYIKVGRLIRYRSIDLERFLADRTKSHTRSTYASNRVDP